jgi:hypothetical protein
MNSVHETLKLTVKVMILHGTLNSQNGCVMSSHLSGIALTQSAGYAVMLSDDEFDPQQLIVSTVNRPSVGPSIEPGPAETLHADWP